MRPLYIIALLWAILITGFADWMSAVLLPIPFIGILLGLVISFCINIGMGAGLIILLAMHGMYHPRFGPFGIIAGLIPGLNVLPFWVGLVIAGIVYKTNAEGKDLGAVTNVALKLQTTYQSGGSAFSQMGSAMGIVMSERRATGRPPARSEESEPSGETERPKQETTRNPLPRMTADIAPRAQYAKAL